MATTDNSSTVDGITDSTSVEQPSPAPKPTTSTPQNGAAKPKPPPPGYKLVRRRKEDGTMITVLRKMTPEELEAAGQKVPTTAPNEGVQYKVVTVRNTDGSYIRVKRPVQSMENVSSTATTTTPASPTQAPTPTEKSATDSIPTIVNAKDQRKPDVKTSPVTGVIAEKFLDSETAPVAQAQGNNINMEAALAEQKAYFRKQRARKYKQSLIRGLGTIAGSAVGHMDLHHSHDSDNSHGGHSGSHDIQDGDIIDSDNDWSDDDMDDDHHDHDDHHSHGHNDANDNDHSRKWWHV
jgi:pyruvate/2-oxoglutarate dehydrogenase complex dihydrolipoamide acyltransferase (E2) component